MKLSIVSYLNPQASERIRKIQHGLSEVTGSKASLLSWEPHVTLADGVEVEGPQTEQLLKDLKEVATLHSTFNLNLLGYGILNDRPIGKEEISTPYALFAKVSLNNHLLSLSADLTKIANRYTTWYNMPLPYQPHVTLAFRDLSRQGLNKGIAYLDRQQISLAATIDHIALVEKLENKDLEYLRIPIHRPY